MPPSGCYAITTKKFNLHHDHREWFVNTQTLYNKVLGFYYELYVEMWGKVGSATADRQADTDSQKDKAGSRLPDNREAMGILERFTIPGRDGRAPERPLPWEKVPMYFRRAAINGAIAAAKSEMARDTSGCISQPVDALAKSNLTRGKENVPAKTSEFHQSVTYYKGMYRDLTEHSISLKVWNGEKWTWTACKLSGNHIPADGQIMSPAVVVREKTIELHVPVKEEVLDGRNAKERMAAGEKIVSAVFSNEDACVVCCVVEGKQVPAGSMLETIVRKNSGRMDNPSETRESAKTAFGPTLFIRGGREYAHKCRQVMEKLEKSKSSTEDDGNAKANQRYWMRIKHLNDSYSHLFSRKIIDYCVEQGAKILVLPEYKKPYTNMVMVKAGNFSPLHLSYQIREKVKYKAWKAGIVVLEAGQYHTGDRCAICGAKAKRCGKYRSEYICGNGHKGNYYLNMARNLGVRCVESFNVQREWPSEKQRTEKNGLT